MNHRIHLLPLELANQIAAGEVIERPASVVKELIENSIDAQATQLEIHLEQGGIDLIRIMDNGVGIHPDDLHLAVTSQATSKIQSAQDLSQITSLGFRGEALASIAAVSHLRLASQAVEESIAHQVCVEFGKVQPVTPIAHPQGTTVEVRELFARLPARRKFLRTAKTEYLHCEEMIKRLALSRFNVGIVLKHNERLVFKLPVAEQTLAQERRVETFYGKAFLQDALTLECGNQQLGLSGWLGLPKIARNQADGQIMYINGRLVKDRLLTHAVRQAYADQIYPGKYPVYLLYLTIDPSAVDVNVHPTKYEVRFHEPRWIHDFLVSYIQRALTGHSCMIPSQAQPKQQGVSPVQNSVRPTSSFQAQVHDTTTVYRAVTSRSSQLISANLSFGKPVGIARQRYVLIETEDELLVIDGVQAECRRLATQLKFHWERRKIQSAPLLFPQLLSLTKKQYLLWQTYQQAFSALGFMLEPLSETTLVARAVPKPLQATAVTKALPELLQALAGLAVPATLTEQVNVVVAQIEPHLSKELTNLKIDGVDAWLQQFQQDELLQPGILRRYPFKGLV